MKRLIVLSAAALMLFACGQKGYTIKGTITGDSVTIKDGTAMLYNPAGQIMIDTTKITDGRFEFKGDNIKPGSYAIYVRDAKGAIPIFLEDGKFTVEADIDKLASAMVKGGETQNLNNLVRKKREEIFPGNEYNALQEELMTDISEERRAEINDFLTQFHAITSYFPDFCTEFLCKTACTL